MTEQRDIRIEVPVLARVEGEGALELDIEQGQISNVKLRIFEPPRFFEKFVETHTCDDAGRCDFDDTFTREKECIP